MPDLLASALAVPGLWWLIGAALAAGLCYGFVGFGAGLVFLPVAVRYLDPIVAVPAGSVMVIGAIFTVLPQAWAEADKRAALIMLGASVVGLPLGVLVLRLADPVVMKWAISVGVLLTLALLVSGWRYATRPSVPSWLGVGGAVGFCGGSVGLPGPPVILFQLGGSDGAARSRANTLAVLTPIAVLIILAFAVQGALSVRAVAVGALLILPYGFGGYLGRRLFRPGAERIYRVSAYILIGAAAVAGLPVFG